MKRSFLTAATLLFFATNAAYADNHTVLEGKIIDSKDLTHHVLESHGQTYQLMFDEPVLLKPSQTVEVKAKALDQETLKVDADGVIVVHKGS